MTGLCEASRGRARSTHCPTAVRRRKAGCRPARRPQGRQPGWALPDARINRGFMRGSTLFERQCATPYPSSGAQSGGERGVLPPPLPPRTTLLCCALGRAHRSPPAPSSLTKPCPPQSQRDIRALCCNIDHKARRAGEQERREGARSPNRPAGISCTSWCALARPPPSPFRTRAISWCLSSPWALYVAGYPNRPVREACAALYGSAGGGEN